MAGHQIIYGVLEEGTRPRATIIVKIGRTQNVWKRIRQMQTGNHRKLYPCFILGVEYADICESFLHKLFRDYKISGEWYRLPMEIFERLRSYSGRERELPTAWYDKPWLGVDEPVGYALDHLPELDEDA